MYEAASCAEEGFIHFCTSEQLPDVASALFAGALGLVALKVEVAPER